MVMQLNGDKFSTQFYNEQFLPSSLCDRKQFTRNQSGYQSVVGFLQGLHRQFSYTFRVILTGLLKLFSFLSIFGFLQIQGNFFNFRQLKILWIIIFSLSRTEVDFYSCIQFLISGALTNVWKQSNGNWSFRLWVVSLTTSSLTSQVVPPTSQVVLLTSHWSFCQRFTKPLVVLPAELDRLPIESQAKRQ